MQGGERVLEIRLAYTATVGDLRRRIIQYIKESKIDQIKTSFQIRSSFPNREYNDDAQTLEAAGLTPNALLFLA